MYSEVFSFIRSIPAPVSVKNLALLLSFRHNKIDFPVVVQLTLGMLPLDSLLFGILEAGFFLGCLMENFRIDSIVVWLSSFTNVDHNPL